MSITRFHIWDCRVPIQDLLKQSLTADASFRVSRLWRILKPILEDIDKERLKMLNDLNIDPKDQKTLSPKKIEKFNSRFADFLQHSVDEELESLNANKIKLTDLSDVKMTPNDMMSINFLLDI